MIWKFEGGPWDGKALELHDDLVLMPPPYQTVELIGHGPVRYVLWTTEDPNIFIYRPVREEVSDPSD